MNRFANTLASKPLHCRRSMLGLLLFGLVAAATVTAADSSSPRHTFFMRGQIVELKDVKLVICTGRADGATVGQELDVVHHQRVSTGPRGMGEYRREVVGKVRIDAIVDDHYAEATVISGKADQYDSVELAERKQ
ncbi:hypothetical protein [Tahibacter amnicola]|uniref:Uncharacterized protein n=1 Tax=Tahibacter amnicola TaxID=2976241 RepID=A0ABY6BA96_9GAMM|nr:hypothetical protein [Tahibacter amnicola]UXI66073.1 hypothetical protein N4264_15070 [Tahibacter amnicola]